jgi:phage terminase small subunit
MGRRPKPATLHMRQGTYKPGRHQMQPTSAGELIRPTGLGRNGIKLWDSVIDFAEQAGAGECDTECLAGMCRWYQQYRRISARLEKLAPENDRYRPLLYGAATAWRAFVDMASRFGLTPADRARLKHGIEETQTTLDRMLGNRA